MLRMGLQKILRALRTQRGLEGSKLVNGPPAWFSHEFPLIGINVQVSIAQIYRYRCVVVVRDPYVDIKPVRIFYLAESPFNINPHAVRVTQPVPLGPNLSTDCCSAASVRCRPRNCDRLSHRCGQEQECCQPVTHTKSLTAENPLTQHLPL